MKIRHWLLLFVTVVSLALSTHLQSVQAAVYWLARLMGDKLVGVFEKRFHRMRSNLDNLQKKLNSRSPRAITVVLVGRFTPGLLVPTSLASGVIGLQYQYFAFGILLSSFVFDASFIALAAIWGKEVPYSELSANICRLLLV